MSHSSVFFNADNEEIQMLLRKGSELRYIQFEKRLKYLSNKYDITFSEDDIAEICKSSIVGKPHIVNFVAQKFGFDKDQLYKDLRKCSVGSARQDAASVIKAVKNSGGVAVWRIHLATKVNRFFHKMNLKRVFINFAILVS